MPEWQPAHTFDPTYPPEPDCGGVWAAAGNTSQMAAAPHHAGLPRLNMARFRRRLTRRARLPLLFFQLRYHFFLPLAFGPVAEPEIDPRQSDVGRKHVRPRPHGFPGQHGCLLEVALGFVAESQLEGKVRIRRRDAASA